MEHCGVNKGMCLNQISSGLKVNLFYQSFPDFKQEAHWDCTGKFLLKIRK